MEQVQGLYIILALYKKREISGWVSGKVGRSRDVTKATSHPTGHMTYTQDTAVSVCEENIFQLFRFTQPV